MSVIFSGIRLPLAPFTLEVDATLNAPMTGIFGASGSGKTSLLELIAGLRRPSAGRINIDDRLLVDTHAGIFLPPQQRAIGYVPQDGALFPHLSVRANLHYGQKNARVSAGHGLTFEHVTDVLEIAALVDRLPRPALGREKQRVALGRALLSAPRLLLLDEPLANLDVPLRERLLPYLIRVRDEFAIPLLYVTHAADEVVALCSEALVLERGRVVRHGPTAELFMKSAVPRYELKA